jgi:hypothetical protein
VWAKLAPSDALAAEIVAAVVKQRAWPQWQRDGGQFIPYPATWLHGRAWQDEGLEARVALAEVVFGKHGHVEAEAYRRFTAKGGA